MATLATVVIVMAVAVVAVMVVVVVVVVVVVAGVDSFHLFLHIVIVVEILLLGTMEIAVSKRMMIMRLPLVLLSFLLHHRQHPFGRIIMVF